MTNFIGLLLILSSLTTFAFVTPPKNNRMNLFLSDSNYELAKEYYEYKTKQLSVSNTLFFENSNEANELSDDDYIEFAKNYEDNYRIFSKNWFIVKDINSINKNFNLELNKFADNIDFNSTTLPPDLMEIPENKITKVENKWYSEMLDKFKTIFNNHPKKVDWRKTQYLTPVKDQKNCGSCWAFSSTSALEAFLRKNNLKVGRLSEQELVDCSKENYGCGGGLMDLAFDYIIENKGIHSDKNYPYNAKNNKCMKNCIVKDDVCEKNTNEELDDIILRNCTRDDLVPDSGNFDYLYTTPYSISSLKESVKLTPVSIAINANTPLFRFYSEGVVEDTDDNTREQINHAVLLVGYDYDDKGLYWIIQNSWGKDWGDNGFIKVRGKEGAGVLSCQLYGVYPINKKTESEGEEKLKN